jgi:hypothetical protein
LRSSEPLCGCNRGQPRAVQQYALPASPTGSPVILVSANAAAPTHNLVAAGAHFLAPGGSKAPLLKMSDALAFGPSWSSFLKKLCAVNRSSPAVQES